ncbi:MAG TPA: hypothetical protein VEI73_03085, partial [Candidatus Acidoferrum sp.]|nr:hypothetical protein [Candidatus Acidoferrum sp.]
MNVTSSMSEGGAVEKFLRVFASTILLTFSLAARVAVAQERLIVLKAASVLDGKGQILHNTIIVVEGAKIARVGGAPPKDASTYDLSRLTVLPG